MAGHLSGEVGCDFSTVRTGNGAILATGAEVVGGAAMLVELDGAAKCGAAWQPASAVASSAPLTSRAAAAGTIEPLIAFAGITLRSRTIGRRTPRCFTTLQT
ncbi:hypothetical protein MSIM_52730 [Mycobacterium simiae]|nr:hypothetical protein MSIM_52730 [Mycobacterium simiae]